MAFLTKAGEILAPWLKQSGVQHHLLERRLQADWAAIVGTLISTHTRPLRLRQRRLTIAAESPAWLHQLRYLEPALLEQIRRAAGPEAVTEVRWVVGLPDSSAAASFDRSNARTEAAPAAAPLSAEAQTVMAAALAALHDPAITGSVRRLMEKALSRLEPPGPEKPIR